jgi:hypothetical protein
MHDLKVQMPLPGSWVSAGALVPKFGATNMADIPTPPLVEIEAPHFKIYRLGTNTNYVRSPYWTRNLK